MKKGLFLWMVFLLTTSLAYAGIPVSYDDYTYGSRTTPSGEGIDSTGGYTEDRGGFRISWEISFDGSFWHYSYTLTDKDGSTVSPDVSHWILEISPEIPVGSISDFIFQANADVVGPPGGEVWEADPAFPNQTQQGANNGNPNLGADLYGVKFDTGSESVVNGTYSFVSTEPPVWGDFYIK